MPGDFIRRLPQFTFETFDAFRNDRPKEERWELIDGVPVMQPQRTLVHQRISSNILDVLDDVLSVQRPDWCALGAISLLLPEDVTSNLTPDVAVIETAAIRSDQVYAEQFFFVVEVLSNTVEQYAGSDRPIVLAAKIDFYKLHEHCRGVLIVRQDRIEADLYSRGEGWTCTELRAPHDRIAIPDIGDIGPLAHLYRHTPHWHATFAA